MRPSERQGDHSGICGEYAGQTELFSPAVGLSDQDGNGAEQDKTRHDSFFGDTHGHFRHVIEAIKALAPDAVVFLGDVQAPVPLDEVLAPIVDRTGIYFIPGNHDTDSETDYDNLCGSRLGVNNLHGRVVDVAGLKIAGLGGIFRSKIWMPPAEPVFDSKAAYLAQTGKGNWWRGGLPLRQRSSIFYDDYLALAAQEADVLVTHEAPSCHPNGFEAIDELARAMRVKAAVHGHHHDTLNYDCATSRLGFRAYGVGFCGILDQDGAVIRPGDQDEQKKGRQALVRCE